jgi:hypothetical protein
MITTGNKEKKNRRIHESPFWGGVGVQNSKFKIQKPRSRCLNGRV